MSDAAAVVDPIVAAAAPAVTVPPVTPAATPPATPATIPPPAATIPPVVEPKPAAPETPTPAPAATTTPAPAAAAAATAAPPTVYALTVPAGAAGWLDASDLTQFETVARAKGWTPEEAQAAIDEHADALVAQSASFKTELEGDTTYGGAQLAQTQRLAERALDRVRPAGTPGGDALRRLLVKTGYGNKLEVVSFLADLGKLMAEDTPANGPGGGSAARDPLTVLYGADAARG